MNSRKYITVVPILVIAMCEWLAFYGVTSNLVLYFQTALAIPTQTSVSLYLAYMGLVYFLPTFGGWIADSIAGRFNAIYGGFLIYFVGALLLPFAAFNYNNHFEDQHLTLEQRRAFFFVGLIILLIGTSGVKANVSPFGAQQVRSEGNEAVQSFFFWIYWFYNMGSIIALLAVVYIQQEIDFFIGYLIPPAAILLAIIFFLIPRNFYVYENPESGTFTELFAIIVQGVRRSRKSIYKFRSFLDHARIRNGGDHSDESVDGLIAIFRMLPIFAFLIPYCTIYFQNQSTFLIQAERMNVKLGEISLPVASLSLFLSFAIIVATPIVDRIVLPLMKKFNGGEPPSQLSRMGFGMVLSAAGIFVAGVVEIARKNDIAANGVIIQTLPGANTSFNASRISVLYQIPQFMLFGLGEIFTSITAMEFAFSEAPDRLESVMMGLSFWPSGIGSFLGSALIAIVTTATKPNNWMPDDINDGHYEYFCFLLGGILILNFILYLPVARWYKNKKKDMFYYNQQPLQFANYGSTDSDVTRL